MDSSEFCGLTSTYSGRYCNKVEKLMLAKCRFWYRYLFNLLSTTFRIVDYPETINPTSAIFYWITQGYQIIQEVNKTTTKKWPSGVYMLPGSGFEPDPYGFPTYSNMVCPRFGPVYGKIHETSEYVRFNKYGKSSINILNQYAEELALLDVSKNMNLYNTMTSRVFIADSVHQKDQFMKMYDEITDGNPAIAVKRSLLSNLNESFVVNNDTNYLVHDINADQLSAIGRFLAHFGVPFVPFEKNSKVITPEITIQLQSTDIAKSFYVDTINEDLDRARKIMPIGNMRVEMVEPTEEELMRYNYSPDDEKGGDQGYDSESESETAR